MSRAQVKARAPPEGAPPAAAEPAPVRTESVRWAPAVTNLRVRWRPIEPPELEELFGIKALPLAPARLTVEIGGAPTALANALRRSLVDEMPGRRLEAPDRAVTTVGEMIPFFITHRVHGVRLRPRIPPEVAAAVSFSVDVVNTGPDTVSVFTGSLTPAFSGPDAEAARALFEPVFNPTVELAFLPPGGAFALRDLRIVAGRGRAHAAFCVGAAAVVQPLDLPRREVAAAALSAASDADVPFDLAAVDAANMSDYAVSSLVADPRRHELAFTVPAAGPDPAEAVGVLVAACHDVAIRLAAVRLAVDGPDSADKTEANAAATQIVTVSDGSASATDSEVQLVVPDETATLGNLLRRAVYDLFPDVSYVAFIVVAHEGRLKLTVRRPGPPAEARAAVLAALDMAAAAVDAVRAAVIDAKVESG
jgi:DNA-directed RNA polymerase subunit L